MADLLLHPKTQQALNRHIQAGTQGVLLIGPPGSGKASLAVFASQQLQAKDAYKLHLAPDKAGSISIEMIRGIEHFLSRRVPGGEYRTIIIEDAQVMSVEAQNALLKMLEEPPAETVFILTADSETAVLPTIRSRTAKLHLLRPPLEAVQTHFETAGFESVAIKRAALMSGGLPGLMQTLLTSESDHPLAQAAELARNCIQKTSFERLAMVDSLAKDRQLSLDVLFMLQQMAHISLASGNTNRIWKTVLTEAYATSQQLQRSGQPKLVLTNLMLALTV